MKETTVVLTERQAERLAEEERRQGVPPDELIRRALDEYLEIVTDNDMAPHRVPTFLGIGASGFHDIASRMEELIDAEWDISMLRGEDPATRTGPVAPHPTASGRGTDPRPASARPGGQGANDVERSPVDT